MKPITREWIAKAEGDFTMMERESRARKDPNYDGICFHAQQCAEKYLKARLCEAGIHFSKTHDLLALLQQAIAVEPCWEALREDLAFLSEFAVNYRYPGERGGKQSAKDAQRRCRRFRRAARESLALK